MAGTAEGDADGDGHNSVAAIGRWVWDEEQQANVLVGGPGDDCDDGDADRFPGNAEICDAEGHDEDCDPMTFGFRDGDGDGHADANCRNVSGSRMASGDDCDDENAGVHPGVPEVCNLVDDDCDGLLDLADDPALGLMLWEDRDRDGYGNRMATPVAMCPRGDLRGLSINDYDCDDGRANRRPGDGCP
jgi:hypothetical protein